MNIFATDRFKCVKNHVLEVKLWNAMRESLEDARERS